jgi:quercetin dioxygenase-like cupin family protein
MSDPTSPPDDPQGLDPDLARAFDAQLGPGAEADDALIARVGEKVMRAIHDEAQSRTVRAAEDGWAPVAPGMECKVLWRAGTVGAFLLRCAPGAALPPHAHAVDEECLVLEGTLRIGDELLLQPGDFHLARAGTVHGLCSTETGCLVYLRGELIVG